MEPQRVTSPLPALLGEQQSQLETLRGQHIVNPQHYLAQQALRMRVEHQQLPHNGDRGLPEDVLHPEIPAEDTTTVREVVWGGASESDKEEEPEDKPQSMRRTKSTFSSGIMQHLVAIENALTERQLASAATANVDNLITPQEEAVFSRLVAIVSAASEPLIFSSNTLLDRHHVSDVWLLWKQMLVAEEDAVVAREPEQQISNILMRHFEAQDPTFFKMSFNNTDMVQHARALLNMVTFAIQNCGAEHRFHERFFNLGIMHCRHGVTPDRYVALTTALERTIEDVRERVEWPDNLIRTLREIMRLVMDTMAKGASSPQGLEAVLAFSRRRDDEIVVILKKLLNWDHLDDRGLPETYFLHILTKAERLKSDQEEDHQTNAERAAANTFQQNEACDDGSAKRYPEHHVDNVEALHQDWREEDVRTAAAQSPLLGVDLRALRQMSKHQSMRPMAKLLKQLHDSYHDQEACEKILFDLGVSHKNYGVSEALLNATQDQFVEAAQGLYIKKEGSLPFREEQLIRFFFTTMVERMVLGLHSTFQPEDPDAKYDVS